MPETDEDVAWKVAGGPYGDGCAFILMICGALLVLLIAMFVLVSYFGSSSDTNSNSHVEQGVNR